MPSGHQAGMKTMIERIDSHCHLWRYSPAEYGWISDRMDPLRRDFLPSDLGIELTSSGIHGAVVVQARQTLEETDWLLSLASQSDSLAAVIGWAPITSNSFPEQLERLRRHPKLKGLRHVIQDEPDANFIDGADFNRGIKSLQKTGLVYEILVFERQLPAAIRFVDRHPDQIFVLDHIGKPRIGEKFDDSWKRCIAEIARRDNVYCKLSGLVTEADWLTWSKADLQPYFDTVLEAFGAHRIMAGSDWPVCLLATTYSRWMQTLNEFLEPLSADERNAILGQVAMQLYDLRPCGVGKAS
jgi:L-fuconolactonase